MITRQVARIGRWCAVALAAGALLAPNRASAQLGDKPYLGTLVYSTALPTGDTPDFVDSFSWLGFMLEGDWFNRPNLSTGFIIGWQEIYQKSDSPESFQVGSGTTTGFTYKHIGSLPILLKARYWAGDIERPVRPFFGLGVGTYWMKQMADFGIYTAEVDKWHFGLAPEVGFAFTRSNGMTWTLNARYNYPFESGEYLNGNKASWSYWGFGFGIGMAR